MTKTTPALRELAYEWMRKARPNVYLPSDLSLHPTHMCIYLPKLVKDRTDWFSQWGEECPADKMFMPLVSLVFKSVEHMRYLHLDQKIPVQDFEIFPVLRACALFEYLKAPIDLDTFDVKPLVRLSGGFYDEELAQGKLPYVLEKHRAESERRWREENCDF